MVIVDSNGIAWFCATGQQGVISQSRDDANDHRWSGNVTGVGRGYETTMIAKSLGTSGDAHFAQKLFGGNHSGSGASSQRWYDLGIRENGNVQLQWEGPHPSNHDFELPANKQPISNIGVTLENNWIGLKWLVYKMVAGGSPSNGGVRCVMWVNTSIAADGRPNNSNWRLCLDFIDGIDAEVIDPQSYQAPDECDVEVRRSDTEDHEILGGGLHWRKLSAADITAFQSGGTNPPPPPPPPPTGQPSNIDKFGVKMIYPGKEDGQNWFQTDDPEFDGQLISDQEVITRTGDYFVASQETDANGIRLVYMRVTTSFGDQGPNCDVDFSQLESTGNVFTSDDYRNVEITVLFYPQDIAGTTANNIFSIEARSGFGGGVPPVGCCGVFRYAAVLELAASGTLAGQVRFTKVIGNGNTHRLVNVSQTTKSNFFRSWTGMKFIVYNVPGQNANEEWVTLELWLCPTDSATDLRSNWVKVHSFIDKGDNWGTGGGACGGTNGQPITWGSGQIAMRYVDIPEIRWKKWSVREIDINGEFPTDPPPGDGGPDPPDPCEEDPPTTPPPPPPPTLPIYKFISWGDNDTTTDATDVLDRIFLETNVSQYLFAGDGPYSNDSSDWIDMMESYFSTPTLKEKLLLTQGNHEHPESESQTAENQIEAWVNSWNIPYKLNNADDNLDWLAAKKVGNAYIIILNSQDPQLTTVNGDQYRFVQTELAKAKQMRASGQIDWIITMVHKSWFNLLGSNQAYVQARHTYAALFADAQVDFMFHGHNHSYAIWRPVVAIAGNNTNTGAQQQFTLAADGRYDLSKPHGVFYIINGNGGHEINTWGEDPADFPNVLYANDEDFGYSVLTIQGKQATITAKDVTGATLFSVQATRGVDTTTTTPVTFGTVGGVDLQAAFDFIENQYDSSQNMLEEAPGFNVFWLWNDQLLGQICLKHTNPSMAQTVENKMNSFGVTMRTPWATLDPQYRSKFSVKGASEPTISAGPPAIRYSDYGGASDLPVTSFADIAFLSAIHYYYLGNLTTARTAYDAGRAMWDGEGMLDDGNITGEYAVYKIALGMLAEKITGFTPSIGIPANFFEDFQNANGGITTDKTGGVPDGSQNVETTAAVLFALNPGILNDPSITPTPNPNPPPPTDEPCNPPPPPPQTPPESIFNRLVIVYNINSDSDGCLCNDAGFTPLPPCPEGQIRNAAGACVDVDEPGGGGGTGGPPPTNETNAIYTVRWDDDDPIRYRMGNDDNEVYKRKFGTEVIGNDAPVYQQDIKRIEWPMRKIGNPTGLATVTIRKGSNNDIAKTLGTINVQDLTGEFEYKAVENTTDVYNIIVGDRILLEYEGGDDDNYIIVRAMPEEQNDMKLVHQDYTDDDDEYNHRDLEAACIMYA